MNQVTGFDFTLPRNEVFATHADVIANVCKDWCKSWVFQLEKGDTGYVHWQGRVRLIKKRRINELKGKWCVGGHISITSTPSAGSFDYVLKADTRIDGPWKDTEYEEPLPLTRQLKSFQSNIQYPWQQKVAAMCTVVDDRAITLIYDKIGNNGKSIFAEYLEYNSLAYEMPPFRLMEDIMQCAMCIKTQKAFLIDMPRAIKKDKMCEFYAGLECLKNGVAYDKRYAFKKKRFDRPQIFVFTNTLPDWQYMSEDRWNVFEMTEDRDLKPYCIFEVEFETLEMEKSN